MDIFRTPVEVENNGPTAGYKKPVLFIGSCFSEHIGNRMNELRFSLCNNPMGILYNPESICHTIEILLAEKHYTASDLGFHNGLWFSFDHHGRFSNVSQEGCLEEINDAITLGSGVLRKASHIFITLGSAWVYQLKNSGKVVANCHKIPDSSFTRRVLKVEEIAKRFTQILQKLRAVNTDIHVVFSLSPVRHTRDGHSGNAYSKSILRVAIEEILSSSKQISYFPAFEIMMDDLRDYRFYESDMLHPNSQAVDYIWKKFSNAWLSDEANEIMKGIEKIQKARSHKPFNTEAGEYRKFILTTLNFAEKLSYKYPWINLKDDILWLRKFLD